MHRLHAVQFRFTSQMRPSCIYEVMVMIIVQLIIQLQDKGVVLCPYTPLHAMQGIILGSDSFVAYHLSQFDSHSPRTCTEEHSKGHWLEEFWHAMQEPPGQLNWRCSPSHLWCMSDITLLKTAFEIHYCVQDVYLKSMLCRMEWGLPWVMMTDIMIQMSGSCLRTLPITKVFREWDM